MDGRTTYAVSARLFRWGHPNAGGESANFQARAKRKRPPQGGRTHTGSCVCATQHLTVPKQKATKPGTSNASIGFQSEHDGGSRQTKRSIDWTAVVHILLPNVQGRISEDQTRPTLRIRDFPAL